MATIKFSQFEDDGVPTTGDILVGLRDGQNAQFTFIPSSTPNAIETSITQTAHGFSQGNIVTYNGTAWSKALADNSLDAEVFGIVASVTDANTFVLLMGGLLTGTYTAGIVYWLSTVTPGAITATAPTTPGLIGKPVLWAISTTQAIFYNMRGNIIPTPIPPPTNFPWNIITTDTIATVGEGYLTNSSGLVTVTLPSTAAAGSEFVIANGGTGNFKVSQQAGQNIVGLGGGTTTTGTGGSLQSTTQGSSVRLVCLAANTTFIAIEIQARELTFT